LGAFMVPVERTESTNQASEVSSHSYQSACSSPHTDMRRNRLESLTDECAQGATLSLPVEGMIRQRRRKAMCFGHARLGEHAWAMTSACLRGDTAGFVDCWTERGSECDDVRFSRRLDAVGAGIDTLVSQIPSSNSLGFPLVVQSPVGHSPTNDAFA
jgi:hypothetical protein